MMIKERKNDLKGRLRPEMHGFREITLRKKIPKGKNKSRIKHINRKMKRHTVKSAANTKCSGSQRNRTAI